jgi:hypothetical protein
VLANADPRAYAQRVTDGAAAARSRQNMAPRCLRSLLEAHPLVVASAIVLAALAFLLGVLWPLTDAIAAHDVGLSAGSKCPTALQAAREAV